VEASQREKTAVGFVGTKASAKVGGVGTNCLGVNTTVTPESAGKKQSRKPLKPLSLSQFALDEVLKLSRSNSS
jgi:hypothetical protein